MIPNTPPPTNFHHHPIPTRYITEPLKIEELSFLSVLGKGSFGTVVLCRRPGSEALYAMKVREGGGPVSFVYERRGRPPSPPPPTTTTTITQSIP